jgi:SAM-dependent methyltransferase
MEVVTDELVALADRPEGQELLQFRSRVGAHQYCRLYSLVRTFIPPGCEVLDWGTGNGHFSYSLVRSGYATTGFSLNPCTFRSWLPSASYRFVQADRRDPVTLPFPPGSFDAVCSIGVLEHVRETGSQERASLREISRVLRTGGIFICYHLPNRHSAIDWLARRIPSKHHHRYRFTASEIEGLTVAAGLDLLEVGRYGLLPRNSAGRLPKPLARSRSLAIAWDAVDAVLGRILGRFCQNYYCVARKPSRPEGPRQHE